MRDGDILNYAIVVLNYNNYKLTQSSVDKLLNYIDDNLVVIVDNNSSNESYSVLNDHFTDYKNVEVIRNSENKGYAAGNNFGMLYIKDKRPDIEYYVIMNPDVEIDDKTLMDSLMFHLENDRSIACISPLMLFNKVLDLQNCFWSIPDNISIYSNWLTLDVKRKEKNKLIYNHSKVSYVDVVPGSFFMIRKKFFEEIGQLDENTFLYNEEIILAWMVREHGYKNAVVIDKYYHHNHQKGERKSLKVKLNGLKMANSSRRYLCSKYYNKKCGFMLNIVCVINVIKCIIKHVGGNIINLIKK